MRCMTAEVCNESKLISPQKQQIPSSPSTSSECSDEETSKHNGRVVRRSGVGATHMRIARRLALTKSTSLRLIKENEETPSEQVHKKHQAVKTFDNFAQFNSSPPEIAQPVGRCQPSLRSHGMSTKLNRKTSREGSPTKSAATNKVGNAIQDAFTITTETKPENGYSENPEFPGESSAHNSKPCLNRMNDHRRIAMSKSMSLRNLESSKKNNSLELSSSSCHSARPCGGEKRAKSLSAAHMRVSRRIMLSKSTSLRNIQEEDVAASLSTQHQQVKDGRIKATQILSASFHRQTDHVPPSPLVPRQISLSGHEHSRHLKY